MQGRQLKGFLSKRGDTCGKAIGSQLPKYKAVATADAINAVVIIASILIDKCCKILSWDYTRVSTDFNNIFVE